MAKLATIHVGPLWEVQFLQGRLEADGIPTFLPDAVTKQVDPFVTGANPLVGTLMVREEDGEAALDLVEAYREAAARAGDGAGEAEAADGSAQEQGEEEREGEEEEGEEERDEEPAGPRAAKTADLAALEDLGRRIRWACLIFVTAPIAVWLGILYLRHLPAGDQRPRQHAQTVVAFLVSVLVCLACALLLAGLL